MKDTKQIKEGLSQLKDWLKYNTESAWRNEHRLLSDHDHAYYQEILEGAFKQSSLLLKAEESITKYDAAIAAKLDELNSREEFEAKPSLLDDGEPTSVLVAKFADSDDGDRRWEDLDLFDDAGKRVWGTGISPATGGSAGAEARAQDYAHSVHSTIDWKSITH